MVAHDNQTVPSGLIGHSGPSGPIDHDTRRTGGGCEHRGMQHRRRLIGLTLVVSMISVACSDSDSSQPAESTTPAADAVATLQPTTTVDAPASSAPPGPLEADVRPGPEQVTVLDAAPGTELRLTGDGGSFDGTVDEQGSLLWRRVPPGSYTVTTADGSLASEALEVSTLDAHPESSFYEAQEIGEGFGYLTVRDGTTLSINVALPGPAENGPYPTVVEYSGYDPSNPDNATFAQLFTGLGFAYVGVNMRGSGCSGGSFDYFEPVQSLDGYDAIEAVAAQPWVQDNQVGMVGISYPGISQLFVAATQPPSLSAITPLSVLDDSYRATLYPGGMLNTGFAGEWIAERQAQTAPFGQGWTKERADTGDDTCAENQRVRLQNPDMVQRIRDESVYDPEVYDPLSPSTFVDRIEVPVFLAGAWQDEQTGGHFPNFLDRFTSAPHLSATLVNGLHTESLSLGIAGEYVEFLQLYVARRAPDLTALAFAAPTLSNAITGVPGLSLPPSELAGMSYDDALAAFEARPPIRVLFEEGAADGTPPGSPLPRFEERFDSWPVSEAETQTWFLADGGLLSEAAGAADAPAASYVADPDAVPDTWYSGSSSGIWRADVSYTWPEPPAQNVGQWTTAPLAADVAVVGSGTVRLWLRSSAEDTDLEVTLSELRPDGTELYVQSGWLRASHRTVDEAASTETITVQRHLAADLEPLPAGEFTEVKVPVFPVGHVFRAGSQLRLTVGAPGGNRPVWVFDTLPGGETNEIAQDSAMPSALVLPVVPTIEAPAGGPPCGSLRGQPCRTVGISVGG